jgi:protein-tyrosine phosphatase
MDDQWADLDSHHIEGIALMGGAHFRVPLISHIIGNLWTGGCNHGVRLPDEFRYVISLYPWEKYDIGPNTVRYEFALYDDHDVPDPDELDRIATLALRFIERGRTLVHCQAGLNRSGLIAGLALVLSGMKPTDAIDLLRRKRSPTVLCNRVFADWLLSLGENEAGERVAT